MYDTIGRKNKHVLGHVGTSRFIGSGSIQLPVRPSKGQSDVLQAIDHSVAGSMTAQRAGFRPNVLRVTIYSQQVASLWVSYSSAEVQSAYSTAPADRVERLVRVLCKDGLVSRPKRM